MEHLQNVFAPDVHSLAAAIESFEADAFDPSACRRNAESFEAARYELKTRVHRQLIERFHKLVQAIRRKDAAPGGAGEPSISATTSANPPTFSLIGKAIKAKCNHPSFPCRKRASHLIGRESGNCCL